MPLSAAQIDKLRAAAAAPRFTAAVVAFVNDAPAARAARAAVEARALAYFATKTNQTQTENP